MNSLNEAFSTVGTRRRYEVWFLRFGLADGSGAWWLRYLLMNPGREGCPGEAYALPVQIWATWFPRGAKPQSFIQGFGVKDFQLSGKAQSPFYFRIGENQIDENSCRGKLQGDGHEVSWDLRYRSSFSTTLSSKGWIGFSRTPHSDAIFSGSIRLDGQSFEGDPLGFGLQGHNCGYRHRKFWTWAHAYFVRDGAPASTLEALVYEMPLGLVFRKAVLWHEGEAHVIRDVREMTKSKDPFRWHFRCRARGGLAVEVEIEGAGSSRHCLPYAKTDCSGSFEVSNNSLARALLRVTKCDGKVETLQTADGAVLEMVGADGRRRK